MEHRGWGRYRSTSVDRLAIGKKYRLESQPPVHLKTQATFSFFSARTIQSYCAIMFWRPYRVECTGSLATSEVKRRRARLVLGWGTAREDFRVLPAFLCSKFWSNDEATRAGTVCAARGPAPGNSYVRATRYVKLEPSILANGGLRGEQGDSSWKVNKVIMS